MRILLFCSLAIAISLHSEAQNSFKRNTLYGEIGGNGLALSVNYERQIQNKPGLGWHVGVGLGEEKPCIPLGVKYLIGLGGQKSFIETGLGITLAEQDVLDEKYFFNTTSDNPYGVAFVPTIGYRHHHKKYGLMWKVNYSPVFSRYRNVLLYYGVAIGWRI
jgi:hypothetical protein